jgi:drug/metabolite transporter (DMT)-like permease
MWCLPIVLWCLVAIVTAGSARASELPAPGTRIRLTADTPKRERWIGLFVSLAGDSVTMRDGKADGAVVAVATRHVTSFELSGGEQSNAVKGAGVGLAIGALLGAGLGAAATNGSNDTFGEGFNALVGAVVVGAVGALVGAVHAHNHPGEHWHAIPLTDLRGPATP